jgi:di/tricarboxylate transporter
MKSSQLARRLLLVALVVLVVSVFAVDVSTACPGCKQALADSKGGDTIAGYFWSILFMMSMPFTLLGGFSGYMYLLVRRARAAAGATSEPAAAESS